MKLILDLTENETRVVLAALRVVARARATDYPDMSAIVRKAAEQLDKQIYSGS